MTFLIGDLTVISLLVDAKVPFLIGSPILVTLLADSSVSFMIDNLLIPFS